MPVANSAFCASKISWNLFIAVSPDILQNARLNGVDGGFVPITTQTRDFAVRVVGDDIGVGDAIGLAFRYKTRDIRRHGPTEPMCPSAWIISSTSTPKSGTAPSKPRQICSRPPR